MKKKSKSQRIVSKKTQSLYANIDWEKAERLFKIPISKHQVDDTWLNAKNVMKVLATVGKIGLVFMAPGAMRIFDTEYRGYSHWKMQKIIKQFENQKYVSVKNNADGSTTVVIQKIGLTKALTHQLDDMTIDMNKKWDKKWRVVIFDVPEKYKRLRDTFQKRLLQLGMFQLQESVYVSPHSCFDEIEFLRELYGVPFAVKYLLAERIEDDNALKLHYHLG
jgi:hypothetical protein